MSKPSAAHPAGMYRHGLSGTIFRIAASGEEVVQEIERDGLKAAYTVDYVIGSGNAALGYLVRVGDALFQSPVTFYTERQRWGMAPGMEKDTDPDFTRPVTAECLWCHAGRAAPVPDTVNRYEDPFVDPAAISCDRCHGPAERHLEEPAEGSIFNPAKAPPRERDSVCEQCHLGGVIRVLHPGQTFGSFEPGRRLEDHWTVFVGRHRAKGGQDRFQVVSHFEQMALSQCAEQSGDDLWCGTCHNPHERPDSPKRYFSERCLKCHEGSLPADHAASRSDCISCHMPRRQSHDSGHSAFTDHRITRRPLPPADPNPPRALRAWRNGPSQYRMRSQGIASILHGQRLGAPELVRTGVEQLETLAASAGADKALLEALGNGLLLLGSADDGLRHLKRAVASEPAGALQFNALAAARWAAGDTAGTESALDQAIAREPTLESSYKMLAALYRDLGKPEKERETWQRLLRQRPRLVEARQALARMQGTGEP